MRTVVLRLLTLSAENVGVEVVVALGAVYLILLLVCLSSIFSIGASIWTKLAWALLAICLPVAGMALYCLWTLLNADLEFLKQFGLGGRNKISQRL